MKLIIGLGNPGEKYQKTRHNIGFMVLEHLLKNYEPIRETSWENSVKLKSDIAQFDWQPKNGLLEKVILVKPKTFMNNSGMAVQLVASFYKLSPNDIWVIQDDIDLPVGHFRIRLGGGDGGHRGIESIIKTLNQGDFWRFRLGIGRPEERFGATKGVDDYVLGEFSGSEWGKIRELVKRAAKAIEESLENGLDSAMNIYNIK